MPRALHFISNTIPGYGPHDGRYLPCSGVPGRAMELSPNIARSDYKRISDVKFLSLRRALRHTSLVCNANSSSYRRSPDFSRQNKNGFSRNRNRHNEDKDGHEDFEESETLSSKNGSFVSFSGNQKFQATATPGPREKEIVELFRKVQAQLRARAAVKEDKKVEESQGKSKENETVDSLLKLLRKHSVQQGKKNINSSNNREFILDHPEEVVPSTEEKRTNIIDSNKSAKHEMQEIPSPHLIRPKSNFQKRSPVPEVKFQSVSTKDSVNSVSEQSFSGRRKRTQLEPETDEIDQLEIDSDDDSDREPLFSEEHEFDEISEDAASVSYEDEHDDAAEGRNLAEINDLSGMKLTELRSLAKSRGMKGFSKLKKSELVLLLSDSSQ